MLRSKEAFYSIKWDSRNWENIFQRKTTFPTPPALVRRWNIYFHLKFLKYDQVVCAEKYNICTIQLIISESKEKPAQYFSSG